jgi:phage baseplate assembly protein W
MATSNSTDAARLRLVLGWDIQSVATAPGVDLGRDVKFGLSASGRDLQVVAGAENLGQQLTTALTTSLGADPFDTRFGFDGLRALVEELTPLMQRERIRVAIIQTVARDPRVRRIVDVRFDQTEGSEVLGFSAGSRDLSVRVEFETVTGASAAVNVQALEPGALVSNR